MVSRLLLPEPASPLSRDTAPLEPVVDTPEEMATLPLEPVSAVPEDSVRLPLEPAVRCMTVCHAGAQDEKPLKMGAEA